jgi:transcriptional regulator NrdR family protein
MASKHIDQIRMHVRDDFKWTIIGDEEDISIENMDKALNERPMVVEIEVKIALSHGISSICEGILILDNGKKLNFCNVVRFASVKKDALIKEAHTYII